MASPVAESSRQLIVDTQQALTSSRRAGATLRAKLRHTTPVPQPAAPGNQARPVVVDPWLELEAVIDRLARLVIHAQALADRTAALPAIVEAADRHRRADHLRLLRAAVDLGQRAITAAAAITCQPGRCRIMRTPQQIDALRPEGDLRNAAAVRAAAYRRSCWTTRPRTLESQQSAESAACTARPWVLAADRPTVTGRRSARWPCERDLRSLVGVPGPVAASGLQRSGTQHCGRRRGLRHTPQPRARPVVGPRGVGQRAVLPSMTRAAQPSGGAQAGTVPARDSATVAVSRGHNATSRPPHESSQHRAATLQPAWWPARPSVPVRPARSALADCRISGWLQGRRAGRRSPPRTAAVSPGTPGGC